MITNSIQDIPLLQPYKEKSVCRIFLEDFLNIAIPFTLVIGGVIVVAIIISSMV